jgi:hypothetical protein
MFLSPRYDRAKYMQRTEALIEFGAKYDEPCLSNPSTHQLRRGQMAR